MLSEELSKEEQLAELFRRNRLSVESCNMHYKLCNCNVNDCPVRPINFLTEITADDIVRFINNGNRYSISVIKG